MRPVFLVLPVLAVMGSLAAGAEMFGRGFQPCGKETSTSAVVECVQAKIDEEDRRLNAAYKALQTRIDANQRHPLLVAFYGVHDGSIRQVQAAECLRSMTEDRARELEEAMKLD